MRTTSPHRFIPLMSMLVTALGLAGCSGGGGGSPSPAPTPGSSLPPAPTLNLTPQAIKTFHFTWTDVTGETEYRLLEDPDSSSGYILVASVAAEATSHDLVVSLPARINARYILQACNSAGCTDSAPVSVSGTLAAAVGYFKASNTGAVDFFGYAVALSTDGDTLAVGAPNEDSSTTGVNSIPDEAAVDSGAVYVYTRSGSTWSQQAYIKASNTGAGDMFGIISVILSGDGNTLAVGALSEDSGTTGVNGIPNEAAADAGAAYVFTRSGATWSQQAYVKASNTGAGDQLGSDVVLSSDGNTLAVSAVNEDSGTTGVNSIPNEAADSSGAVYVYTRSGNTWTQQAYIKAHNTGIGDWFGYDNALSADGNTLAVGANNEESSTTGVNSIPDDAAIEAGAVYVFTRSGGIWGQQAYIKASNTEAYEDFGSAVAISHDGNTLAVGAPREDSGTTGVNSIPDETAGDAGAVYVFTRSGNNTWSQDAYVKAHNTGASDNFGWSVAMSADGNSLAVGARSEDSGTTGINSFPDEAAAEAGAVYVFARSSGIWGQQAYVKASNPGGMDERFGFAIALSGDGKTLGVGTIWEDSGTTGVNSIPDEAANAAGAVYVY